jgi:branched-subunit amino acid transport protein
MNLDGNALLLSLVVSSVGLVCLAYGKKQGRVPQIVAGLTLIIFPYFVSNLLIMALVAVAVLALLTVAVHLGA